MDITAAVVDKVGAPFRLSSVALTDPAPDEVVVRILGVGLCHTDLAVRDGHLPFSLPGVLGHEGSGVVLATGSAVTKVAPGDGVVLTFSSCGACASCRRGEPAYCSDFGALNFGAVRADGAWLQEDGKDLGGGFFGQSSFASHAITSERNIVKVEVQDDLALLGPLGCGVQTGAGAIMNSLDCQPGSTLLVLGGGSVGLSAVLAGVVREQSRIIVVEPHAQRRELALSLGATDVIDPADGDLSELVRGILPEGVDSVLDTTGVVPVIEGALLCVAQKGKLGLLGIPKDLAATVSVPMLLLVNAGMSLVGIVEGDSVPDMFIPYLVDLYRAGRFPFDKFVTQLPLSEINEAVATQHRGEAVKVVLVPDAA